MIHILFVPVGSFMNSELKEVSSLVKCKYFDHTLVSLYCINILEALEMEARCERNSCVRGYHIYISIWDAVIGEELPCFL